MARFVVVADCTKWKQRQRIAVGPKRRINIDNRDSQTANRLNTSLRLAFPRRCNPYSAPTPADRQSSVARPTHQFGPLPEQNVPKDIHVLALKSAPVRIIATPFRRRSPKLCRKSASLTNSPSPACDAFACLLARLSRPRPSVWGLHPSSRGLCRADAQGHPV